MGESSVPKNQYTMSEFVNDTYLLITNVILKQYNRYDKIHVYGTSMGGAIVQNLIIQYPQYIQSVVIGCSLVHGTNAPKSNEFIEFIKQKPPTTPDELRLYGLQIMKFGYTPELMDNPFNKPYFDRIIEYRNKYKRDPVGARQQSMALNTHNTESLLPNIRLPVLIQHGTDDSLLLYSNGELLHKLIPNSVMSTYSKAGHIYWANDWMLGDDSRLPTELRDWYNKYENTQMQSSL